jgi:hypothetical protein
MIKEVAEIETSSEDSIGTGNNNSDFDLENEKLRYLYSFPSMTRITEPRMRWAGHVV